MRAFFASLWPFGKKTAAAVDTTPYKVEPSSPWPRETTDVVTYMAEVQNPCLECGHEIPAQTGPGRRRKFCSDVCSATHHNRARREFRAQMKAETFEPRIAEETLVYEALQD